MTLALKNAVVERDVVNLIFPDEVQVLPAEQRSGSRRFGLNDTDLDGHRGGGDRAALQRILT